MRHLHTAVMFGVVQLGCSGGEGFGPADQQKPPFEDEAHLQFVGFGGSVLNPQKRFVGYARQSHRVSVIDPDLKTEVWGREVPPTYKTAYPLFDYSGVAMINATETELRILTDGKDFSFSFSDYQGGHFSRAAQAHAFAAWSQDGSRLQILRFDGSIWRQQKLTNSVDGVADFVAPPQNESPAMVSAFYRGGTKLVNFHPANGTVFVHELDAGGDFVLALDCAPLSEGSVAKAHFRALALDDQTDTLFVGDVEGAVWALSLTECNEDSPKMQRTKDLPVTELTLIESGRVAVTQAGGGFHIFSFDGTSFAEEFSGQTGCEYPRGAINVDDELSLVVCYEPENLDAIGGATNAPAVISFRKSFLQSYSRVNRTAVQRIDIIIKETAGVAIDAKRRELVRLLDSTLGVLEVVNLETGNRRLRKGIFLNDILGLD